MRMHTTFLEGDALPLSISKEILAHWRRFADRVSDRSIDAANTQLPRSSFATDTQQTIVPTNAARTKRSRFSSPPTARLGPDDHRCVDGWASPHHAATRVTSTGMRSVITLARRDHSPQI